MSEDVVPGPTGTYPLRGNRKIIIETTADGFRRLHDYCTADVKFVGNYVAVDAGTLPGITGNWEFGFRRFEPSPEPRVAVREEPRKAVFERSAKPRWFGHLSRERKVPRHKKKHLVKGAR